MFHGIDIEILIDLWRNIIVLSLCTDYIDIVMSTRRMIQVKKSKMLYQ